MALDKQINLFKVDTNAFLNKKELNKRKSLVKMKKERDVLNSLIDKNVKKSSIEETAKYIEELKEKGRVLTKYEQYFIVKNKKIKEKEKECKEFILKKARNLVEYNNLHKKKNIRKLLLIFHKI